ncbi:flagellar motor protein [Beggiatoa alba B18LD]|uniref:Flagellar motor protein n=1 Tax=Beggiatoa alba B18LD TaxID=395493 RepID=I3CJ96_9GAMM|nr:OmpA family protein [Beggiatoa alba]EIJ43689.1 flagellar motor protein [Beggiatoa alba B18LD]
MSRIASPAPPPADAEDSYLASLSDLMVGLLFIFIIILMAFALNYRQAESVSTAETVKQQTEKQRLMVETQAQQRERQRLEQETDKLREEQQRLSQETARLVVEKQQLESIVERLTDNDAVRRTLLRDIERDLQNRGVRVFIDEKNGILRLPEELLFASAQANFRPEGEHAIQQLANVLAEILPCYSQTSRVIQPRCKQQSESRLEAVFIEGHTDNKPINTPLFKDNWALANARAINTYQALIANAPLLDTLQNGQTQALLSVSAYEARRPVADQTTEEGRRQNRRIDLRFLMASPPPELIERAAQRLNNK